MSSDESVTETNESRGTKGKGWTLIGGLILAVVLAAGTAYFALSGAGLSGSPSPAPVTRADPGRRLDPTRVWIGARPEKPCWKPLRWGKQMRR